MRFTRTLAAIAAPMILIAACGAQSTEKSDAAAPAADAKGAAAIAKTDMAIGRADAPLTLIEYASVTCPHCATWHAEVLPELKQKYVDAGKLRIVFREFPTPPADFSYIGSLLARCAGEKSGANAYFLVIGALMNTQQAWIQGADPKGELMKIAGQAGLDAAAFDACLKRQDLVDLINANVEAGAKDFNISRTPSFVLNGEKIESRTTEEFIAVIDEKLGAKAAK
jgi:protein-disulfide isomerase